RELSTETCLMQQVGWSGSLRYRAQRELISDKLTRVAPRVMISSLWGGIFFMALDQHEEEGTMQRVFSGIQPTGNIHIGNYLGAIRNWVEMQHQYESLFCIVDYHAITVEYEPKKLHERVLDLAATLIASGIDPNTATLFVQSSVPEHTELTWLLTCITSIGALERMTQFKDKSERQKGGVFAG